MKNLIWITTEEYEDVYSNRIPYVAEVDRRRAEPNATMAQHSSAPDRLLPHPLSLQLANYVRAQDPYDHLIGGGSSRQHHGLKEVQWGLHFGSDRRFLIFVAPSFPSPWQYIS